MKIFTSAQIKACDAYTIHASSISSSDLMERAAGKCVEWLTTHFPKDALFVILCGTGNNGGDGLAITRLLHHSGYGAKAFLLKFSKELSKDCQHNLQRLQNIDPSLVDVVPPDTFITDIPEHIIVIDAILGTGLNRPVEGWVGNFINQVNLLPNKKIAIDIPSGLPADTIAEKEASIVKAQDTLSFQFYKRSFLHPESGSYTGNVHLLDIGLDKTFIEATHSHYQVLDRHILKGFFRQRDSFTHKGSFGTSLIIGGSYGLMGSVTLTARAAYRAGAGRVRGLIPEAGYDIFQTITPEAMCITSGDKFIKHIKEWESADAIAIGPGMGTEEKTMDAFEEFLEERKDPIIIDADALNILGKRQELLNKIPAGSILTPHPKEFERVFGETANTMVRVEHARTQAMRYNIIIVLKDRYTAVVTPEGDCWYNVSGNAGLATGGSGDVLTGIITGLYSQKYEPAEAAMLGVYLHGLAADLALQKQSMESLVASDVMEYLGAAFKTLY
jgi:NAD(P)H-hydrate epimerase